jgi:hypothetical protein
LLIYPSRSGAQSDAGIVVRPHKTINTRSTARIFEWTPALKLAVEQAKAARPIDFSPWLFCTSKGEGYFNENSGQASGWDSMWQRFMTRLLKDTTRAEFESTTLAGRAHFTRRLIACSRANGVDAASFAAVFRPKKVRDQIVLIANRMFTPSLCFMIEGNE